VNTVARRLQGFDFPVLQTDSWCDDDRLSKWYLSPTEPNNSVSRPYCGFIEIPTFKDYQEVVASNLPLRCGDGRRSVPDEVCDDGNSVNGDGCNATCKIEPLSECDYIFNPTYSTDGLDSETMKPLYIVSPPDSSCRPFRCGDGERNLDWEQCDDANSNDLDGCTKECKLGAGYTCERNIEMNENGDIIADRGELCTPFILPWNGADPDCPRCSGNGQCVLFENVKYCLCLDNYNDLGVIKYRGVSRFEMQFLELKDAAYLQVHEHVCREINECDSTPGPCSNETLCVNTIGSFDCRCISGKQRVVNYGKIVCVDVDECLSFGKCVSTDDGGVCKNTDGSFECRCRTGYSGTGIWQDWKDPVTQELVKGGCEDIDECNKNSHSCVKLQSCVNTVGSFQCICPEEYPIAFPPTDETGASISTYQAQEQDCWSSTFMEDNDEFFMRWGRDRIVNSLHGLVRLWYLPQSDDSAFAKSGLARWWSLKGETAPFVHNGAYLVPFAGLDVGKGWRSQSQNLDEKLSLPWTCAAKRNVKQRLPGGFLSVNISKELGTTTSMWIFDPFETSLYGFSVDLVFEKFQFDLYREPGNYANVIFCHGFSDGKKWMGYDIRVGRGLVQTEKNCTIFNASYPPSFSFAVKLPFTMQVITANQVPETMSWNLFSMPRDNILFAFKYGLSGSVRTGGLIAAHPGFTSSEYLLMRSKLNRNDVEESFLAGPLALSVSNKANASNSSPCQVNRRSLTDEFSTFHVTPSIKHPTDKVLQSKLSGIWTGRCGPEFSCKVNFFVQQGMFELWISDCDGYSGFANGRIEEYDQINTLFTITNALPCPQIPCAQNPADTWTETPVGLYRRFKLHYAAGGPNLLNPNAPEHIFGYGSYRWTDFSVDVPDSITVKISTLTKDGSNYYYPGDRYEGKGGEKLPFDQSDYTCQVMDLKRVFQEDAARASLITKKGASDPNRAKELAIALDDYKEYTQCRRELQNLDILIDRIPNCKKELEPFLSATSSILSQSQDITDSCSSACLPQVVKETTRINTLCSELRDQLFGSKRSIYMDVDTLARMKARFTSVVIHTAEFLFRLSIICTGNYKRRRCHEVLARIPSVGASCRDRCYIFN
jgi:cysteine-rich repeat protein